MSRHNILIINETHRGLLFEDGVLREVLTAGRHRVPRPPSALAEFFGSRSPGIEVALIDVRARDLTIVVRDLLTADCATISASFVVRYRVADPRAAVLEARDFEDRLLVEAQTAARRTLRGLSLGEVIDSRDEIGEELQRLVADSAAAYGLEVSSLDFKDLVLPDEFREALNRAACARRLPRYAVSASLSVEESDEEGRSTVDALEMDDEEPEVRLARMTFEDRDEARPGGQPLGESERFRRFRP